MIRNKIIKRIKQVTAGFLTGAMVFTCAPLGNITANAATVLPPNGALFPGAPTPTPPSSDYSNIDVVQNSSESTYGLAGGTAYTFGTGQWSSSSSAPGKDARTFNIGAITQSSKNAAKLADKGMSTTARSAYGSSYWATFYGFGRVAEEFPM